MPKPGIKTTELWVTILTDVGLVTAAIAGNLSPQWAAVATSVSTAAYSISRAITKSQSATTENPTTP